MTKIKRGFYLFVMKTNNLIFDIGGVIILQPKADWSAKENRLGLKDGTIKRIFVDCFNKQTTDKNFNERKYFEENYSDILSWEQYQNLIKDFFASEKVNEPLLEWTQKKKVEGYRIYALTNNTAVLEKLLKEKFKIEDIFDKVFNSAEIGLAKPDPKIFQYLLSQINANPEQCLFVDDSQRNVEAAGKLGLVSILFMNNQSFFEQTDAFKI